MTMNIVIGVTDTPGEWNKMKYLQVIESDNVARPKIIKPGECKTFCLWHGKTIEIQESETPIFDQDTGKNIITGE